MTQSRHDARRLLQDGPVSFVSGKRSRQLRGALTLFGDLVQKIQTVKEQLIPDNRTGDG